MKQPSQIFKVPILKAKKELTVDLRTIPDAAYHHILALGLKTFLNSHMHNLTFSSQPNVGEFRAKAMEQAKYNLEILKTGLDQGKPKP